MWCAVEQCLNDSATWRAKYWAASACCSSLYIASSVALAHRGAAAMSVVVAAGTAGDETAGTAAGAVAASAAAFPGKRCAAVRCLRTALESGNQHPVNGMRAVAAKIRNPLIGRCRTQHAIWEQLCGNTCRKLGTCASCCRQESQSQHVTTKIAGCICT